MLTCQQENLERIIPFWQRFPQFFTYPAQKPIFFQIALLSIIPVILIFIISGMEASPLPNIVILLISLPTTLIALRYASNILLQTSYGRLIHQHWRLELSGDSGLSYIPFKILIIIAASVVPIILATTLFGLGGATIANILVMLAIPATLMNLIISNSLLNSLNLEVIYNTIRAIGKPYLLLCVCLLCLSSSSQILSGKLYEMVDKAYIAQQNNITRLTELAKYDSKYIATLELARQKAQRLKRNIPLRQAMISFCSLFISYYLLIIGFNMMGYVLYQNHRALALDIDDSQNSSDIPLASASKTARYIAQLLAAGQTSDALELAYEAQRLNPSNLSIAENYNKLLHLAGENPHLFSHTKKLIPLLLSNNLTDNALNAFIRCRERDPDFKVQPSELIKLARAAQQRRDPYMALDLLNNFERIFPDSSSVADSLFLRGQILSDNLRQDEKAKIFFNALCLNYPQHHNATEAQEYLNVIRNLQNKI